MMQHRKSGKKLGRTTDHRQAMIKNMVTSLIESERITTTEAKAKELRRTADKMITLGKKGDLAAVRRAGKTVKTKAALAKLFKELAPKFEGRNGGYTRIMKAHNRKGDNAPMVVMEWVEGTEASAEK